MSTFFRQHPLRSDCDATLVLSGADYFDRLEQLIRSATQYLHLQFYILDEDITGNHIISLLKDASRRGVKVMLVADGYASARISPETIRSLTEAGVLFKLFSPINRHLRIGRRLHHKIVVADGKIALIGGINIADKYSGRHGKEPWLDFAVELRGSVMKDIDRICESIWKKKVLRRYHHEHSHYDAGKGSLRVRLLQNDWWRRRIEISKAYRDAIRRSEDELCIVASYLLPNNSFRRLIRKAIRRGVKVNILLGGFSDVRLVRPATKFLYEWLLKQGVGVFEWNKSVLHGKMAISDRKWVTVGSYNINSLSDYGSLELNAEISDPAFATHASQTVNDLIAAGGNQITYEAFKKDSTLLLYAYRWCCYQLIRVALRILFILMRRDRLKMRTLKLF